MASSSIGVFVFAGVAGLGLSQGAAHAQQAGGYPNKAVRMIVPFPAGGTADTLARITGQKLTERWGQPVIVDNRPGAGGNIGAEALAKSAPDGYTLMMGTTALAISAGLYRKLPFDVDKDFTPVTLVASVPMILVVHPSVPAKSVRELLALAKARPGLLAFSSAGNGTPSHLAGELFRKMTGTNMIHVPYKGGAPAVIDLLAGQVSLMLDNSLSVPGHIKAGKLRALGVSSKNRSRLLPDVPTIIEAGVPGYEFISWFGVFAPAGVQKPVTAAIYGEFSKVLAILDVQEKLRSQGAEPVGNTPDEFARLFRADVEKLAKVIAEAGARID
ncbi:MAG: tripartite tricarboxylate transporter substrate binding protein [Betaproteobacteria bacterium]|nr:tripartite tricarboxylate transporter substrate binding protein [Betaproteobacteria bacterium]